MKTGIVLGLGVGLLFGAQQARGADEVRGEETLQGTWRLVEGEANGEPLTEQQLRGGKLVINGDHYEVRLDGLEPLTGVQTLDPSAKTIDITGDSGPDEGQTCLGIYELEGDEFRVAFAPPGEDRPSEMTTTPDSGHWLHVWERVQE